MLPVNILEPIINASQISADRFLKVAGYDKTLECTILRRDENNPEIYYVSTTGFSSLMVYAQKNAPTYAIGSTVLVNVPEGNFDGEKTIIGEVVDKNTRYKINDPADDFVPLRMNDEWEIEYDKNLTEKEKIYPPLSGPPKDNKDKIIELLGDFYDNNYSRKTNIALLNFSVTGSLNNNNNNNNNNFYQILGSDKIIITFRVFYRKLANIKEELYKEYYWQLSNYFGNICSKADISKNFSILFSVPNDSFISKIRIIEKQAEKTKITLESVPIKILDSSNDSSSSNITIDKLDVKYGFSKKQIEAQKLKNGLYLDFCFIEAKDANGKIVSAYMSPIIYDSLQEKYCIPCKIKKKESNEESIRAWKQDILWLLGHNYYQDYTNIQLDGIRYDETKDIEEILYIDNIYRSCLIWYLNSFTKPNDTNQMIPTSFFYRITAEHLTRKNNNLLIESKKIELKE